MRALIERTCAFPSPRLRGEGLAPLVGGEASGATVRGLVRTRLLRRRPLTPGCRLDTLPDKGETRPSPRERGEGMRTRGEPSKDCAVASRIHREPAR